MTALFLFAGGPAIFAGSDAPPAPGDKFDLRSFVAVAASNLPSSLPAVVTNGYDFIMATATAGTNGTSSVPPEFSAPVDPFVQKMQTAHYLRKSRQMQGLEPMLVSLLDKSVPETIQKSALLELALLAQDENNLPRAQQIYAQFLNRWPDDIHVPEVLLGQGRNFRQMGLHNLALTKFYAVMTTALTLKSDRMDYYEHLVVEAQMEIAETHFNLAKYSDAAEYYSRLFKQNNPEIDRPRVLFQLVRCYCTTSNYDAAVGCAQDYLAHYPDGADRQEARFYLATAFKQLGRDNESLQQVLILLRDQSANATGHPEAWAYWRQRAGNLIANQFYREGDYPRALDIYNSLVQLDISPQWQLPVSYQIGMTYEHLMQPQKAMEIYNQIVIRQAGLGTNSTPSLASIADMARWRIGFIRWQNDAQSANHHLNDTNAEFTATANKAVSNHE